MPPPAPGFSAVDKMQSPAWGHTLEGLTLGAHFLHTVWHQLTSSARHLKGQPRHLAHNRLHMALPQARQRRQLMGVPLHSFLTYPYLAFSLSTG